MRIFLPPNLAAAAARDAIALRLEVDLDRPDPAHFPALALVQRWCGGTAPPSIFQVTTARLRELQQALAGLPVFYWAHAPARPIPWRADALELGFPLAAPPRPAVPPAAAAAVPPRAARPRESASSPPLVVDGSEHYLAVTLPGREDPRYAPAVELLKKSGFVLEPANRRWWLRDRHRTLNFLAENWSLLRDRWDAEFTANFTRQTARLHVAEIEATAAPLRDGDFEVAVGLRAGAAPEATLRRALAEQRSYVEEGAAVYLVPPARLATLAHAQQVLAGSPHEGVAPRRTHRVARAAVGVVADLLGEVSPGFAVPAAWRERGRALHHLSQLRPAPLAPVLDARLRPYQRLGVAWLCHLYEHELAGILADEMGLGKTLQAIAFLTALPRLPARAPAAPAPARPDRRPPAAPDPAGPAPVAPAAPSLVVAPASLLENWRRELARFAPGLRVLVYHGADRHAQSARLADVEVVVTSYGTVTRDRAALADITFAAVIADEAQHVKNRRSQNAAALRRLRSRGRFLLTGTPLENSLDDLRSLFEFLLPGYLERVPPGLRAGERAWYDARLREKTAPYILRRTKRAVAPELPERIEQVVWCELGPAQAALYRRTAEKSERALLDLAARGAGENAVRFAALTQLLRLRQIACDPRLVETPSGGAPAADAAPDAAGGGGAGEAAPAGAADYADSAKLDALRELLDEAVDDGHRLLVFSQFTGLLALVRRDLESRGLAFCYLDGSMSPPARQAEVDRFQGTADIPVFLLSLKAGGSGLNLTAADTVVHLDPWWNPAAEAQATDRAHRIGQTRTVTSYKLIASGTVEEKVLALQDSKRALLADVFSASDAAAARISLADLRSLLVSA